MKLKEIRVAKGRQQKELAISVGTDEPMMSKFENYKCLPTPPTMKLILKELGCSVEDIYEPHEVYYAPPAKPKKRKRKTNVYRLTAELPEEAREFFKSGALQKCGFQDITAWANWCYTQLKRTHQEILQKEKTSPSLAASK